MPGISSSSASRPAGPPAQRRPPRPENRPTSVLAGVANQPRTRDDSPMRAFLDDRSIEVPEDGGAASGSVAAAISAARAQAQARGRVIIDVLIDGERIDEE